MSNFSEVFIENSYDSDYSQEFRLKGSSQFRENNYIQAYNSFTKAIMCNDVALTSVNYVNRSICNYNLYKYDASVNDAKAALAIDSNNIKAYERMGMGLLALRLWDEAIESINKGLEIEPKNVKLLDLLKKAKAKEEIVTEKRTPIYDYFLQLQDKSPLFEAIFYRDFDKVKMLIDQYQCDPHNIVCNEKDEVIMNALHVVAVSGNSDPALDHDTRIEKYLLDLRVDITVQDNGGLTPINLACLANRPTTLKTFLDYLVSKNEGMDDDLVITALKSSNTALATMLEVTAREGYVDIAKILLENKVKPTSLAVKEAAKYGHSSILRLFLENDVDINATEGVNDEDGLTALESAIVELNYDCVELLLKKGAKLNVSSNQLLATPVEIAAKIGDKRLFELLLKYEPKISNALLQTCIKMKRGNIVKLIKEYSKEPDNEIVIDDELDKKIEDLCNDMDKIEIEPVKYCNCCKEIFDLTGSKANRCSRCKKVYYCCRDCQVKDWKTHKLVCQA
ncbi:ankyrin [Piromyces finnis]|uniref:Ankyrin n=1 Tax=Piromyces finnis TaxID=1754191 RepID=A0A1Y1VKL7_9FUNG|nr:ankyrin [Piromyces finnis]|eukprot:ORX58622.1 ankyrin [Piromyces finnis]